MVDHPSPDGSVTGGTQGGALLALGNLATTNSRSYMDVKFRPTNGNALDEASVLDANAEFALTGAAAGGVAVNGTPSKLNGTTFRYYLSTSPSGFDIGLVSVNFSAGAWKDATDTTGERSLNLAFSQEFTAQGATASMVNPGAGGMVGRETINGQRYLEVTFLPTAGRVLDHASINGDELVLKDAAGAAVSLAQPQRVGTSNTYRFSFTSTLAAGVYTVQYNQAAWTDDSGISNLAATESFTVEVATAALGAALKGQTVNRESLNANHFIDVTFTPTASAILDQASILDSAAEFTLTGAGGENVVLNGTPTQPGALAGTNTFRYSYSGLLNAGVLTVNFTAGSWQDAKGNTATASTGAVKIITQASNFYIELSGGIELRLADFFDEPVISLKSKQTLEVDYTRNVITLDYSGQLNIIKLGTVGSSAGRFILDLSGTVSAVPQFWGVATVEANLEGAGAIRYLLLRQGHAPDQHDALPEDRDTHARGHRPQWRRRTPHVCAGTALLRSGFGG